MNDFQNIMYDLILESLSKYVESGELDIDEAEVLSEAAYDNIMDESRRMDREIAKYYDKDKKSFVNNRPEWTKSYPLEMMGKSYATGGDIKNRDYIHSQREVYDRHNQPESIWNNPTKKTPRQRAIEKFNKKQSMKAYEYFKKNLEGNNKNKPGFIKGMVVPMATKEKVPMNYTNTSPNFSKDHVWGQENKEKNTLKNKLDLRKKIPALLTSIMN